MPEAVSVTLPSGARAVVRPLCGGDEEFLIATAMASAPERDSALLARCLVGSPEGSPEPWSVRLQTVREMSVGDRDALLLWIRKITFGDEIQCTVVCPRPECGQKLDFSLSVGELLQAPRTESRDVFESQVSSAGTTHRVRYRPVNGADLESVAAAVPGDEPASAILARRCLIAINGEPVETLPDGLVSDLSRLLLDADPHAELRLQLRCPECSFGFESVFDAGAFLGTELTDVSRLYREVHVLAFHYHWSEQDILALTPQRRRSYLDLLSEQLRGANIV